MTFIPRPTLTEDSFPNALHAIATLERLQQAMEQKDKLSDEAYNHICIQITNTLNALFYNLKTLGLIASNIFPPILDFATDDQASKSSQGIITTLREYAIELLVFGKATHPTGKKISQCFTSTPTSTTHEPPVGLKATLQKEKIPFARLVANLNVKQVNTLLQASNANSQPNAQKSEHTQNLTNALIGQMIRLGKEEKAIALLQNSQIRPDTQRYLTQHNTTIATLERNDLFRTTLYRECPAALLSYASKHTWEVRYRLAQLPGHVALDIILRICESIPQNPDGGIAPEYLKLFYQLFAPRNVFWCNPFVNLTSEQRNHLATALEKISLLLGKDLSTLRSDLFPYPQTLHLASPSKHVSFFKIFDIPTNTPEQTTATAGETVSASTRPVQTH